jgi:hypothetical protein
MRSTGAGGCDFVGGKGLSDGKGVLWAPHALPSVIALTELPADLADPKFALKPLDLDAANGGGGPDHIIEHQGAMLRVHLHETSTGPPAVLLPLDHLFDIRVAAASRLWCCLTGRKLGPNPAALSQARRDRLILGLRALDGKLENASYRDIADALFGLGEVSSRGWKTHDLRDRAIRLVRFGLGMMRGGYRSLLLHPYRRRS